MKKVTKLLLSLLMLVSVVPNQLLSVSAAQRTPDPIIEDQSAVQPSLSMADESSAGKVLRNLRAANTEHLSIYWEKGGNSFDSSAGTYSMNGANDNEVGFRFNNDSGTNNTVVVLTIPDYGLKFGPVPSTDSVIEETHLINDHTLAIRFADSTSSVTQSISVSILTKALTEEEIAGVIDHGYESSDVCVSEYSYSGDLDNILDEEPLQTATLFSGIPAVNTDAEISATHTYKFSVPYITAENASHTDYVLAAAGSYNQYFVLTPANHDGEVRFALPSASDVPIELVKVRIYVPSDKLQLTAIGDVTATNVGKTNELTASDYDFQIGNWVIGERQEDSNGVYYEITPKEGTRFFNNYFSYDRDVVYTGMYLTWQLVDQDDGLTPDTTYQAANYVITYKVSGNTTKEASNLHGAEIVTYKKKTATSIDHNYNDAHSKNPSPVERMDATVGVSYSKLQVISTKNSTKYDDSTQTATEPLYIGPAVQTYEFPYQIQPTFLYIAQLGEAQAQVPTGFDAKDNYQIESISYTTWNGSEYTLGSNIIDEANRKLRDSTVTAYNYNYVIQEALPVEAGEAIQTITVKWANFSNYYRLSLSSPSTSAFFDYTATNRQYGTDELIENETKVQMKFTESYSSESGLAAEYKNSYTWFRIVEKKDPALIGGNEEMSNVQSATNASYAILPLNNGSDSAGRLGVYVGLEGERKETVYNPIIRIKASLGKKSFDAIWNNNASYSVYKYVGDFTGITNDEAIQFLDGTFKIKAPLVGWSFVYRTNLRTSDQVYTVTSDDVNTTISLLNAGEYFTSLCLKYDGEVVWDHRPEYIYNNEIIWLIEKIGVRLLSNNMVTGEAITIDKDFYMGLINVDASLEYDYTAKAVDESHTYDYVQNEYLIHGIHKNTNSDTAYPVRVWAYSSRSATLKFETEMTSSSEVKHILQGEGTDASNNDTGDMRASFTAYSYVRPEKPVGNPGRNGGRDDETYGFNRSASGDYSYGSYAFHTMPGSQALVFPWGSINEAVYIELTDPDFQPDLTHTVWAGYSADSSEVISETITVNGKTFLKLTLADGVSSKEEIKLNTYNKEDGKAFENEWNHLVLAFNTLPGVAVGAHHPVGKIYFDFSGLEAYYNAPYSTPDSSALDDGFTKYELRNRTEDIYGLSPFTTNENKNTLYELDGSSYTVQVSVSISVGAELAPGKGEENNFSPRTTNFLPTEENILQGLLTIKGAGDTGASSVYEMTTLVVLPRVGTTVDYLDSSDAQVKPSDPSEFNMWLTDAPYFFDSEKQAKTTIKYTTDSNPSMDSAFSTTAPTTEEGWKAVTALLLVVDQVDPTEAINIRLNLASDEKKDLDVPDKLAILHAYAGGLFKYRLNPEADFTEGYLQLAEWEYGNIEIKSGTVFWDLYDENGVKYSSDTYEAKIKNVEVTLYDKNGNKIDETKTDSQGTFVLRTYMTEEGQYIEISNPVVRGVTVKLTKRSENAPNKSATDSDFDRDTNKLVLGELTKNGERNISAGFVQLPKISAPDVVVPIGMTLPSQITIYEYVTNTSYSDRNVLISGYSAALTGNDESIATVSAATLARNTNTTLKLVPEITGVAGGQTECTVTVTNSLGDEVTATFKITVGKLEITAEGVNTQYDGQAHKGTYATTFNDQPITDEISYMFSLDNGATWTSTEPSATFVDDNKTGILVKAVHSEYGESDPVSFDLTITPRPLTLTGASKSFPYDGYPHKDETVAATGLASGDRTDNAKATGSVTNVADTAEGNNPVAEGYVVLHGTQDVTNCYTITTVAGTLTIEPRFVIMLAASADASKMTKDYDGTPLTCDEWKFVVGSKAPGDTHDFVVTMTEDSTITDYGTQPNVIATIDGVAVQGNNVDNIVGNYKIRIANGTLTVNRKYITIYAGRANKLYDSTPLTCHEFSFPGVGPASTDTHVFTVEYSEDSTITNIGTKDNVITKVDGVEISSDNNTPTIVGNYLVVGLKGTLIVEPFPVIIWAGDAQKDYDGTELTFHDFTLPAHGLHEKDNHVFEVEYSDESTITLVGTKDNIITKVDGVDVVCDNSTEQLIGNYMVRVDKGVLRINDRGENDKLQITVEANSSLNNTYDGTEKTASGFKTLTFVVNGKNFTVEGLTATVTEINAGTYTNEIAGTAIVKDENGNDVTAQFAVEKVNGQLVIAKRQATVTVTGKNKTVDYNGEVQTYIEYEATTTDDLLRSQWGETPLTRFIEGTGPMAEGIDAGEYPMHVTDFSYSLNDRNVAKNYEITWEKADGSLTINKVDLTITVKPQNYVYNGQPQGENNKVYTEGLDAKVTVEGLKGEDRLGSIKLNGQETNAGQYPGKIAASEGTITWGVRRETETALTKNYNVTYVAGQLNITADEAALVITSASQQFPYDGQLHKLESYTVTYKGEEVTADASGKIFTLPNGDVVTITPTFEGVTNVTDANNVANNNTFTYTITNGEDRVEGNYANKTATFGTVEIIKKAVTVKITGKEDTKVYNSRPQYLLGYTVELPAETDLTLQDLVHHVPSVDPDNIPPHHQTLDIDSRDDVEGCYGIEGRAVGNYPQNLKAEEFLNTNENYEVTFEIVKDGVLHITPAQLTITVKPQTYVYNGQPQGEDNATYTEGFDEKIEVEGLQALDSIKSIVLNGQETNANVYENKIVASGLVLSNAAALANYDVSYVAGTLTINKRSVTLTSATDEKVYDGNALINATVTVGGDGFAAGEGATYNVTGSQTIVGHSENTFTYTLNEGILADNYTITPVYGTLTVTDRPETDKFEVNFVANSGEADYDATAHVVEGFTTELKYNANGVEFTIEGITARVEETDAGTYAVAVTGTPVVRDAEGNDVTAQFKVSTEDGQLTINKATLTVTTPSASKILDGEPLTDHNYTVEGLQGSDSITVNVTGSQTEVGTSDNTFTIIWDNAKEENYDLVSVIGQLTVTLINNQVVITASSATRVYNGAALRNGNVTVSGLPAGYRVEATVEGSQTNAGTSANRITGYVIYDEAGNDATALFTNVRTVNGTLRVNPRALTITTGSAEKEYDGLALTNSTVTVEGLVAGESVTVTATGSQSAVGSSANTYSISWDNARSGNYRITENLGTLTVTEAAEPTPGPEPGPDPTPDPPLAGGGWALINLLSAIGTTGVGGGMLATYFKKKKEEEEEGTTRSAGQNGDAKEDEENTNKKSKLLGIIPSAASIITFLLTEDMSSKMVMTDKWTVLMVVMLAVNGVLAYVTRNKNEDEEEQQTSAE